jgi:hypothetical protein
MIQLAVTLKDGDWTVFKNGTPVASGMSRSKAIILAEEMAFAAEEAHDDVELLIQEYTGELRRRRSGGG